MIIGHSPKTIQLDDGSYLHFWYANNAGRSGSNSTITRSTEPRTEKAAAQPGVIASVKTSAWNGKVNFSQAIQKKLGLKV